MQNERRRGGTIRAPEKRRLFGIEEKTPEKAMLGERPEQADRAIYDEVITNGEESAGAANE